MQHYIRIVNCRDEVHFVLTLQKRKKKQEKFIIFNRKGGKV
jgi:hypothetical protein